MENKVTAEDIRKALLDSYKMPEWHLGFEVGNSTGSNCKRHADAVAINSYPSRGFEIRGFEIKVSRSDLKHELDNGLKADEVARFCNYWFLVVPKGLTKDMMIPEPWGIIEYSEGKLRTTKKATYFDNKPDIGFMMAFMRGWERVQSAIHSKEMKEIYEESKKFLSTDTQWKLKQYEELLERLKEVRKLSGIDLTWGLSSHDMKTLKIAHNLNRIHFKEQDIDYYTKELLELSERLKTVLSGIKELSCLEGTDNSR